MASFRAGPLSRGYPQGMARRPGFQRGPRDIKVGTVAPWPAEGPPPQQVAATVRYEGNGEHKTYPAPNGEWTPAWHRGKARCARFDAAVWPRLQELLRRAILAQIVDRQFDGQFPRRAWAFINGVLHEARLTNAGTGSYHGFPLEYPEQWPDDPMNILQNAPHENIPLHQV